MLDLPSWPLTGQDGGGIEKPSEPSGRCLDRKERKREYAKRHYRKHREERLRYFREKYWRETEKRKQQQAEVDQLRERLNNNFMVAIDEKPLCPRCLSPNVRPKDRRIGKYMHFIEFRCCVCRFTFSNGDGSHFPKEIREFAIIMYRKGLSRRKVVREIINRFHLVVGTTTIRDWVQRFYEGSDNRKKHRLQFNTSKEGKVGYDQLCDICGGRIIYDQEVVCSKCGIVHKAINEHYEEQMRAFLYFGAFQEPSLIALR